MNPNPPFFFPHIHTQYSPLALCRFANAVQSFLEMARVVRQLKEDREARVAAAREDADKRLKVDYPILWRIPEWREKQLSKAEPHLEPLLPEALWQAKQARLADGEVYLAHHIAYNEVAGPAVRCVYFEQLLYALASTLCFD